MPIDFKQLPLSLSHYLKDFGVGLAKGIGQLAEDPGYAADLATGGAKFASPPGTMAKSQQYQKMITPTNMSQRIGAGIGSLTPGSSFATPALQKVGVPAGVAFGVGLGIDVLTPGGEENAPKAFTGFKDLTTKVLERLKGKSITSKQEIMDFTNMPELKQAERDLIRNVVGDYKGNVPVQEFANKVKTELLPLDVMSSDSRKLIKPNDRTITIDGQTHTIRGGVSVSDSSVKGGFVPKWENTVLPSELRGPVANYSEHVYQSPIKTSAGDIHFGGSNMKPSQSANAKGYFAHTRIEDLPAGTTRRVIELQSDLFQKGRLENESPSAQDLVKGKYMTPEQMRDTRLNRAGELQKLEPYRNTWHERVIREEVKQAAKDGKTLLQFPTGETAMKIEGLGDTTRWNLVGEGRLGNIGTIGEILPNELKVGLEVTPGTDVFGDHWIITDVLGDGKFKAVPKGYYDSFVGSKATVQGKDLLKAMNESGRVESFDISGKVDQQNPIYKFYEKEVGRYLKNKYNAEMITDPQGVNWWQVKVPKEAKRMPIEAFGVLPFALPPTSQNKNNQRQ